MKQPKTKYRGIEDYYTWLENMKRSRQKQWDRSRRELELVSSHSGVGVDQLSFGLCGLSWAFSMIVKQIFLQNIIYYLKLVIFYHNVVRKPTYTPAINLLYPYWSIPILLTMNIDSFAYRNDTLQEMLHTRLWVNWWSQTPYHWVEVVQYTCVELVRTYIHSPLCSPPPHTLWVASWLRTQSEPPKAPACAFLLP